VPVSSRDQYPQPSPRPTGSLASGIITVAAQPHWRRSYRKETRVSTDAIVMLKEDHTRIKRLFRDFEQAGDSAHKEKADLVTQILTAGTGTGAAPLAFGVQQA
jgi:hypothetical protein